MADTFFEYTDSELSALKERDKRLARVIDKVGHIYRRTTPDLYVALVQSILGQQISAKASERLWQRVTAGLGGAVTPERVEALSTEELKAFGTSYRKAEYIKEATHKIVTGELDLKELERLDDEEVCQRLMSLKGVGRWTAEMLMIFSMGRLDILSYDDLAIIRGMKMVYHHKDMPRKRFERYRKRFAPYGSIASLYFWKVAGGQGEVDV